MHTDEWFGGEVVSTDIEKGSGDEVRGLTRSRIFGTNTVKFVVMSMC